ncbi:hypothetical protein R84B8_02366 [Treponema sp. R8-4-B8]
MKTQYIKTILFFILISICSNIFGEDTKNISIYTVGYYANSNNNWRACFWKNTVRTDLKTPVGETTSTASGITIANGTVYTAGYLGWDSTKACYWTGTMCTDLHPTGA